MTRSARACGLVLLTVAVGCSSHDDIRARYRLEQMLWQAQFFQRRMNISFLGGSKIDTRRALDAYREVVAADPLARAGHDGWDPAVVADIRRIEVSARIALANLYFLSDRYADAGTIYNETLRLGSITLKDALDARLGAARSSFMEGDDRAVIAQCEKMFRDVAASSEFWNGDGKIDDVFLNIPTALVRLQRDSADAAAADSSALAAAAFYARVRQTWPGTRADWQSRLAIVQLHMIRGEWNDAARGIEEIIAGPGQQAGEPASLELVLGEIRAFTLSDRAGARERFDSIVTRYPGTDAAYVARYDLAALLVSDGEAPGAIAAFRDLEQDARAPDAVVARAMFARGKLLEASGAWDDAYALFRRLEQLHPYTTPAVEAPLVVTRHYLDQGERELADASVAHAREYYLSLIDRRSQFAGDRMMVQAALTESYVMSGKPGEVAELLGTGALSWDEASTATGMLKAADLYRDVMHDPAQADDMLQRIIERFPETRYAHVARRRLDDARSAP